MRCSGVVTCLGLAHLVPLSVGRSLVRSYWTLPRASERVGGRRRVYEKSSGIGGIGDEHEDSGTTTG